MLSHIFMAQDFLDFQIKVSFNYGYLRENIAGKNCHSLFASFSPQLFFFLWKAIVIDGSILKLKLILLQLQSYSSDKPSFTIRTSNCFLNFK
jgi:hypothetical protein